MADRFPSLEEFGEEQTGPTSNDDEPVQSNAADDFLARERATLGNDAAQFATADDTAAVQGSGDGDLLDGDKSQTKGTIPEAEMMGFESSYPAIDAGNQQVGPGGTITGSDLPFRPSSAQNYNGGQTPEESEPIRQWRERRDLALAERERISASKKEETIKTARKNLDDFYENYSQKTEKQVNRTRKEAEEFLANRQDTTAGGTSWERIAKLVDLSGKGSKGGATGTGKDKFREMLLNLRKDEKAPGAAGV